MKLLASSIVLYLSLLLELQDNFYAANALRLSLHGKRIPQPEPVAIAGRLLEKRVAFTSGLDNKGDINYFTNLTLGGKPYSVLVDTGSSDLYVNSDVNGAKDTGKKAEINYAIGHASGPIQTAALEFEGYSVPDQAFVRDTSGEQISGDGIIGLGPNSGSIIRSTLNNAAGDAVLDRIFRLSPSTPNFVTTLLGRSDDPDDLFPGDFTVGEVIDNYTSVLQQPKMDVFVVQTSGGQHWQALLDVNGTIGPDGQPVQLTSHVKGTPKTQLNVIFDTGFTFSQVPKAMADAFYGRVPGATLQNFTGVGNIYVVPCDVELNVSFKFGNVSYPIHALDTVDDDLNRRDELGNPICMGAFQPILQESSNYDAIFGMNFLRNVYMLINFGDFVDGSNSKTADPYIQLLTTTDIADSHHDFVIVRLGGIDNAESVQLLPASVLPPNEDDTTDDDKSLSEKIHPYLPYIIAGSAVLGVLLLVGVAFCVRDSRKKKYRRLHDPAPAGMSSHQHRTSDPPFATYQPARRY